MKAEIFPVGINENVQAVVAHHISCKYIVSTYTIGAISHKNLLGQHIGLAFFNQLQEFNFSMQPTQLFGFKIFANEHITKMTCLNEYLFSRDSGAWMDF